MNSSFIELGRTIHLSVATGASSDEVDLTQPFGRRGHMTWTDLLARPRVVILSGGGSGKTFEIQHRAKMLHEEGRPAFFLRIEHVRGDFEGAFDKVAGNHQQFQEWVMSGDEGWIFLDSVDEARLNSPKEFEQAINYVGRVLGPVLQRAHVVITGREAAWRARSDRELIRTHLPYESSTPGVQADPRLEPVVPNDGDQEIQFSDEVDADDVSDVLANENAARSSESEKNSILIVGFDTLSEAQVETFVRSKGISRVSEFLRAVKRKEAQQETARPLDLEGLVDYWNANGTIGGQLELTQTTITRRLEEVDPDRVEATTLSRDQLRYGARLIAVANLLIQAPDIRQHGAPIELRGVEPAELLDWAEPKIRTLLLRPLFVASQFGAVRIYVQKAREFLAAEWFCEKLVDHASRARIEALFFRTQYGQEVVVPAMRGVLPWLALLDSEFLAKVRRVAPEVMFEGGDPSRLPTDMRRDLLSKACKQLAEMPGRHGLTDFQAVQRFAAPDLDDHIRSLLITYRDDVEVVYFLMRMIWQGEIVGALDLAKTIACSVSDVDVRLIAMRAVADLGTEEDREGVRTALLASAAPPEREWIAEAVESLPRDAAGVIWLLQACVRAKPEQRYSIDPLPSSIEAFVADSSVELLPLLVAGLQKLVAKKADQEGDEVSSKSRPFDWLVGAAIATLNQLVRVRNEGSFNSAAIALLLRIPATVRFGDQEDREDSLRLGEHVAAWEALNRALFWAGVESARASRLKKSGEPLVDIWSVGLFGRYWRFCAKDFNYLADEVSSRALLDDKLVALSAALSLYRENDRPPSWRQRLRRRAKGVPELVAAIAVMLGPASEEVRKRQREEALWKKRSARKATQLDAHRAEWRAHLRENLDLLRTPHPEGRVRNSQYYLLTRMREFDEGSSRHANEKWVSLIPEFGVDVAKAYRDGAIAFWRINNPLLLSEGATPNSTPIATLFGLNGLLFESLESRDWAARLTPTEAELAARYAMHELNGFPPWLPRAFEAHPEAVTKIVLSEIDYELRIATAIDSSSHYVLSDISSVGGWMWPSLAPELLSRLDVLGPSARHLGEVLTILSGSKLDNEQIAACARKFAVT